MASHPPTTRLKRRNQSLASETGAVLAELRDHANAENVRGMARYGINPRNTLGVPIPVLRDLAKRLGKNHDLALALWRSDIHEARILASMIADPDRVTGRLMDEWARDFDSWDVCDQVCSNLFQKTRLAHRKALQWSARKSEFVKRAGFVLMARIAVAEKELPDGVFAEFFDVIEREAWDDRRLVRKAISWALRQIGKRNRRLNRQAIQRAEHLHELDIRAARWVASDALRDLRRPKLQARLE